MKYFFTLGLLFAGLVVNAQVKLLTLNELEQRISKGKDTTYVVNFWATWCGPCVEELPNFEKLNQLKSSAPTKVLLVSLDFKSKLTAAVIPFVKKNKLKSEVWLLNETDQQVFIDRVDKSWSGSIPATLFIKDKGNVRIFKEQTFTYDELIKVIETFK